MKPGVQSKPMYPGYTVLLFLTTIFGMASKETIRILRAKDSLADKQLKRRTLNLGLPVRVSTLRLNTDMLSIQNRRGLPNHGNASTMLRVTTILHYSTN